MMIECFDSNILYKHDSVQKTIHKRLRGKWEEWCPDVTQSDYISTPLISSTGGTCVTSIRLTGGFSKTVGTFDFLEPAYVETFQGTSPKRVICRKVD